MQRILQLRTYSRTIDYLLETCNTDRYGLDEMGVEGEYDSSHSQAAAILDHPSLNPSSSTHICCSVISRSSHHDGPQSPTITNDPSTNALPARSAILVIPISSQCSSDGEESTEMRDGEDSAVVHAYVHTELAERVRSTMFPPIHNPNAHAQTVSSSVCHLTRHTVRDMARDQEEMEENDGYRALQIW
ncbi:hypothetical protein Hypma_008304 [Hypsizygus marmoreus]|uniref:Uncharacterized protein n=1 Tax=Hypsizygus marmoreus TaxID=39966 RepID=A0A369JQK5_HYPMA|nr:hypothetical protein Hypma_008304 [Hypsizygus marmoreus]